LYLIEVSKDATTSIDDFENLNQHRIKYLTRSISEGLQLKKGKQERRKEASNADVTFCDAVNYSR
jgi:hypothetical protein